MQPCGDSQTVFIFAAKWEGAESSVPLTNILRIHHNIQVLERRVASVHKDARRAFAIKPRF
jgi:hypothetical protein